jgi:hypothetical protein
MKLRSESNLVGSRYEATLTVEEFTVAEEQSFAQYGEFEVEIGGTFSGSVSRPEQTNTTVVLSGGGFSSAATAVPVIDGFGRITGVTVVDAGADYSSAPSVSFTGDGQGAAATAVVSGGIVTAINVTSQGYGYHVTPVNVNFNLGAAKRRIKSEFPIKQVFDLRDYADADARAKVWIDTLITRITTAKREWLDREAPLKSYNVTTI